MNAQAQQSLVATSNYGAANVYNSRISSKTPAIPRKLDKISPKHEQSLSQSVAHEDNKLGSVLNTMSSSGFQGQSSVERGQKAPFHDVMKVNAEKWQKLKDKQNFRTIEQFIPRPMQARGKGSPVGDQSIDEKFKTVKQVKQLNQLNREKLLKKKELQQRSPNQSHSSNNLSLNYTGFAEISQVDLPKQNYFRSRHATLRIIDEKKKSGSGGGNFFSTKPNSNLKMDHVVKGLNTQSLQHQSSLASEDLDLERDRAANEQTLSSEKMNLSGQQAIAARANATSSSLNIVPNRTAKVPFTSLANKPSSEQFQYTNKSSQGDMSIGQMDIKSKQSRKVKSRADSYSSKDNLNKKNDSPYAQRAFRHQYGQLAAEVDELSEKLMGSRKHGSSKIELNRGKKRDQLSPLMQIKIADMQETDLPSDMTKEHFYHVQEQNQNTVKLHDHLSNLNGLWGSMQNRIKGQKHDLECRKPGYAYSNPYQQFSSKNLGGNTFGKDKRKLSEPAKILGVPSMSEINIKTAVLQCFPDQPVRKPKVNLVEVNDMQRVSEISDLLSQIRRIDSFDFSMIKHHLRGQSITANHTRPSSIFSTDQMATKAIHSASLSATGAMSSIEAAYNSGTNLTNNLDFEISTLTQQNDSLGKSDHRMMHACSCPLQVPQ